MGTKRRRQSKQQCKCAVGKNCRIYFPHGGRWNALSNLVGEFDSR